MRKSAGAHLHELHIVPLLLLRERGPRKLQEDETREQSDVRRGHLLPREDDAGIDRRHLLLLVQFHVHAAAPRAVPKPFEELHDLRVDVVLVLVDVRQCVCRRRHRVVEGGDGGVLDIRRFVADGEEREERVAQFRLAAALRAEKVEDGKPMLRGRARGHVAEERGEVESEAHAPVVAEHLEELLRKLPERHRGVVEMHELLLEREEPRVVAVDPGRGGQVEIALLRQPYDAVLVRLVEPALEEDAVAESVEALALPAHLLDLRGRFRFLVEERLEFGQFLFRSFPNEIPQALNLLLEL